MEEDRREKLLNYIRSKLAEAPQLVKNNLEINGDKLKFRRGYWRLKKYVDDFLLGEKSGSITKRLVLLPGLRGVGKTTLVYQIYDYLINFKKIEQERVLYFSADELNSYLGENTLDVIHSFIEEIHDTTLINLDKEIFILIDESHFDKRWSEGAKIVFDKSKKIFLIFTGSSALDLEMNVDSARRITREPLFPINFSEYLILNHNISPPKGTAKAIRNLIFNKEIEPITKIEKQLLNKTLKLKKPLKKEFEDFLIFKGFPFSMKMGPAEAHSKILNMTERVVEKDVFSIKAFNTDTRNTITRILTFLSLQSAGGISDSKLAKRLGTSPTLVRSILDVLEKTHLVFSIKPYGSAGKVVNKPWKYYFLSSCINSAFRFKLGSFDFKSKEMFGLLAENLVASYLIRMKETLNSPMSIFYDSEDRGVDFLIKNTNEKIIPIGVGFGKKNTSQIRKAIKKYKSEYGIVICDCESIKQEENIIFIPLTTFAFV
ncbi:MAG: ATP-binding protein [Nanoarchaeota archaeon]